MKQLNIAVFVGTAMMALTSLADADFEKLKSDAMSGDGKAQASLGMAYYTGKGIVKNETEAINWFKRSSESGCAEGQYRYGCAMLYGVGGLKKDSAAAVALLEKAAKQNYRGAKSVLGDMYLYGDGVERNLDTAKDYLIKAAEMGSTFSQERLGQIYLNLNGIGDQKDEAEALKWYTKAADGGKASAQATLGAFYQNGNCGLKKDTQKAKGLYEKAAAQGNAFAQYSLARLYDYGDGVVKDAKKASELYRDAAKGGLAVAQSQYAIRLARGEGVVQNIAEALVWCEKAVAAGDATGKKLQPLLLKLQAEIDFSKKIATDVVNGKGEKESGYSSAQLDNLKEELAGKILTFEKGTVSSVSKGYGGKVNVTMSFEADKSKVFFASRFMVTAKISDPTIIKWAQDIDEGAVIKSVTGKVDKGGMFFTIVDAKLVVEK